MATRAYFFTVHGIPKPQPRPRMTKSGHVYTPDSAKAWKELIIAECLRWKNCKKTVIDKPVKLSVVFLFPFPKRVKNPDEYVPHAGKPDTDNLLKAVMDALTTANIWTDDALVYSSLAEKWYYTGESGVRIKVDVINDHRM